MTNRVQHLLGLINKELLKFDLDKQPQELYEPIRYMLELGGKRLRPLLTLLSYGLFREDPERIVRVAMGVEVFHNFTLMHDDIMDQAPIRRGKPTVHEKWSPNIGILSGDVMLIKAYQLLEHVETEKIIPCLKAFNSCAAEVCEGQQIDMNFEKMDLVSERSYLQMIRQKTAVLLGFSMELGAILADAPEDHRKLLKDFGVNIGLGFQLKDDLLDVYGDQSKFGKQVGGDIIANKKTYLLTQALEQTQGGQQVELKEWLKKKSFKKREKVKAVTAIYDQLEIRRQTELKINGYFQSAYEALDRLPLEAARLQDLRAYTDYLTNRDR